MKRIIIAVLLFVPVILAQQPKPSLSPAEVKARADKRRSLQWYVIEPMTPCISGALKRLREGEDPLDVRYGRYKFRLEATTFEEMTGLDPKSTDDLDPILKEYLKRLIADDLLRMYRKGTCKDDPPSD